MNIYIYIYVLWCLDQELIHAQELYIYIYIYWCMFYYCLINILRIIENICIYVCVCFISFLL